MAPPGTFHVRRHVVRTRVARGGAGRSVAAALGGALTRALADRLPALVPPGGDEGVWLVRRLDVRAAVSGAWPPGRIADVLARATLGTLTTTLGRGASGDTVLWFPDRAAFLARFLTDVASGRAAGRWEYAGLAGASARPASVLAADVIRREPAAALAALVRLAPADRRRLQDVLTAADAGAVLAALAEVAVAGPGDDPAPLVAEALGRLLDRSDLPEDRRSGALALFLEVALVEGPAVPRGTDARARDVADLANVLGAATDPAVTAAVGAGDWARVGVDDMSRLAALVSWPAPARREAVRHLTAGRARRAPPEGAAMTTGLGGMFLLLPLLQELPWDDAFAGWPPLERVPAGVLLRYLAVIGALGAGRNRAAAGDPVLRLALGVPGAVDAPALHAWSAAVGPARAQEGGRVWAAGLARRGKASGEVTVAPLGDGVVAVDGLRGIWLGTALAAPESVRDLLMSVDAVTVAATEAWIEAFLEGDRPSSDPADGRLLTHLDDQARYATVGPPLALAPAVGEVVMVAAQALGRELAWRLPGFSRSSLPYLGENVLAFDASVAVEPKRLAVAVGDPPLHLVLTLAGMNRTRFRLAATGDREWTLARAR